MKRLLFLITIVFGIISNAQAQLTVLESGRTLLGNGAASSKFNDDITLNIWDVTKKCGGYISFGMGAGSMIGGDGASGSLILKAMNILALGGPDGSAMIYDNIKKSFTFRYFLQAPSYLTLSDARFKSNISSMDGAYSLLSNINPVSYNLTNFPCGESLANVNDISDIDESVDDGRLHYGFIAQEVREIFPNLVVEDEDGLLSIDYTGFIPLLVDAYKQLSEKVQEQDEFIASILNRVSPSYMPASVDVMGIEKASLKQNQPNPFSSTTTIECVIPEGINNAFMCIYDLQGKQVMRIDLRERGNVSTVIEASSLVPGMYIYSLITDGVEVDSKRMIITD